MATVGEGESVGVLNSAPPSSQTWQSFLPVGRRKQYPRVAEPGDPQAQPGCLCRSDSALASEPTVVPSARQLPTS